MSKEFLRDLGCRIDLGRGHLFFEKLGVRAVVTSEQSPHLLLPLTSFGPQASALTNVQSTVPRVTDRPPHLTTEHQKLITPTQNPCLERVTREKPYDEARDYWENRKGRWVRVHGIARQTLFDPMHDEQPFCQGLTERRRTTARFLG